MTRRRRNPSPDYAVVVNRRADDDVYAWKILEFVHEGDIEKIYTLPPEASVGDLTGVIYVDYVSDVLPHLECLGVVGPDFLVHSIGALSLLTREYAPNYIRAFELASMGLGEFWKYYTDSSKEQTTQVVLSALEFIQSPHIDRVVLASIEDIRNFLTGDIPVDRIYKNDRLLNRLRIETQNMGVPNEIRNVKNSSMTAVIYLTEVVLILSQTSSYRPMLDKVISYLDYVNQVIRDIYFQETGRFMPYSAGIQLVMDRIKPYFSIHDACLARIG